MEYVIARSRRYLISIYTTIALFSPPIVTTATSAWAKHWVINRSSILMMTAINTVITTGSEISVRTIWPIVTGSSEQSFIVKDVRGENIINRQSLISIFMTLFASLLGGPVYFLTKARYRFLFFISFGLFNSVLSQSLSSLLLEARFHIFLSRLVFDFVYTATIKFTLFELTRKPLLSVKQKVTHVGFIRIMQDFLTTILRVAILGLLGIVH